MRYAIIYRSNAYRVHRSDCSDVKKDRVAGTESWFAEGDLDEIIAKEIEVLAEDGIEIEAADFRILPCARGEGR